MKVNTANFCKNRFCPMCSWRLAQRDASRVSVLMEYIAKEHKKDFVVLTFTAPNVKAEDLKSEIDRYNKAFKKLVERDKVERVNKGYIRKLEITYNNKQDTYHPHFHVVMAVNASYFQDRTYIKQSEWLNLWRDVMDCPEITQVDVRRAYSKKEKSSAAQEVAKYSAKDSDYNYSQAIFDVFYEALRGRQVMTYNGLFATANKAFKAGELSAYVSKDETVYYWLILYTWKVKEYSEKQRARIEVSE